MNFRVFRCPICCPICFLLSHPQTCPICWKMFSQLFPAFRVFPQCSLSLTDSLTDDDMCDKCVSVVLQVFNLVPNVEIASPKSSLHFVFWLGFCCLTNSFLSLMLSNVLVTCSQCSPKSSLNCVICVKSSLSLMCSQCSPLSLMCS